MFTPYYTISAKSIKDFKQKQLALIHRLSNFFFPLQKSQGYLETEIDRNFYTKGRWFGVDWPKLRESTIRVKRRLGYGDKPPMVRTGRLYKSFTPEIRLNTDRGEGSLRIYNPTPYFASHQHSDSSRRTITVGPFGRKLKKPIILPRRVMLKLLRRHCDKVVKYFWEWIRSEIKFLERR